MKYSVIDENKYLPNRFISLDLSSNPLPNGAHYLRKEYKLQLSLGLIFTAQQETFDRALDNAHHRLTQHIYGDVLRQINEIRAYVYGADGDGILLACESIEKEIMNFNHELISKY